MNKQLPEELFHSAKNATTSFFTHSAEVKLIGLMIWEGLKLFNTIAFTLCGLLIAAFLVAVGIHEQLPFPIGYGVALAVLSVFARSGYGKSHS